MSQQSSQSDDDVVSGDLPAGAVLGDPAVEALIDRAGDLDYTTERLRQRERELRAEFERNARMLQQVGPSAQDITGRGWAADRAVSAEVDADNRLVDLQLDPKALRLGSIDNLRKAILSAYAQATDDVANQLREAGAEALPPATVQALLDSMPELTAIMPEGTYTPYLESGDPSGNGAAPPSTPSVRDRTRWEEKNVYE